MKVWQRLHNMIVAALVPMILCAGMAFGQTAKLDDLFNKLKAADPQAAERIEQEIWIEWSKSGSAAMDLLLERGRRAMSAGQLDLAVEHLPPLSTMPRTSPKAGTPVRRCSIRWGSSAPQWPISPRRCS
jgi:hypothetical protein